MFRIGGRPVPNGEARFRSDRRRREDHSSPCLTVPTAPSGKTHSRGRSPAGQSAYPRTCTGPTQIHPRISRGCGRNVDASTARVCYGQGGSLTVMPGFVPGSALGISSKRSVRRDLELDRCDRLVGAEDELAVRRAGEQRWRGQRRRCPDRAEPCDGDREDREAAARRSASGLGAFSRCRGALR
jgi:hypothetical protein